MSKQILLDGVQKQFSIGDLPMLIHAKEGSGGSLFSVSLIADLYHEGAKILFLSGYHMARDEFQVQTSSAGDSILVDDESQLKEAHSKRVIFVGKEAPELFIQLVKSLPDIDERVIFFKNFELFDASIFETVQDLQHLILMGDVDTASNSDQLLLKSWTSCVYFSEPTSHQLDFTLPSLDQYQGYLHSKSGAGFLTLSV